MTETELLENVIDLAQWRGWMVHHCRPARTEKGWRTAIQGTAGFPDLVLARNGMAIFAELKGEKGKLTNEQLNWLVNLDLHLPRCENAYLWFPKDWRDGTIDRVLR